MTVGRVIARIAIGLAVVVVVVLTTTWFAFSNDWAARRIIAFALGRSTKGLSIADVIGPLRGPLVLKGIKYRSGALSAEVDSVYVAWRPQGLLHRRVQLDQLYVTGLHIFLPDSAPKDTSGTNRGRREKPNPRIEVLFGDAVARGIDINAFDNVMVTGGTLELAGSLTQYRWTMTGSSTVRKIPRLPELAVQATGTGDLEQVHVDRTVANGLDGKIRAAGTVRWWPTIEWDLRVDAEEIRPGLLMPDSTSLPGRVTAFSRTTGLVDSSGPTGHLTIDSTRGALRGQPVRGKATVSFVTIRYHLDSLDGVWGPALIRASGAIGDTVDLAYIVDVPDLRAAAASAKGSISARGRVVGPIAATLVHADIDGTRVGIGALSVVRLHGRADVDLAPSGRNDADLVGESGTLGRREVGQIELALRGTHSNHRIAGTVVGHSDSLLFGIEGGLRERSWTGQVDTLRLTSTAVGRWDLVQPVAVAVSPTSARLDSLCLIADSAGGRACAAGEWHGGTTWNGFADVTGIPLTRVAAARLDPFAGGRAAFRGTLGVRADARSTADRLDATLRARSDTIAFTYREKDDSVVRRLALDSAVVDVKADKSGLVANLGVRVLDDAKKEVLVLIGQATVPDYRVGQQWSGLGLTAALDGKVDSLSFARPLFNGVDSLTGSLVVTATANGRTDAPTIDAHARLDHAMVASRGNSIVTGSADLVAKGTADRNRAVSGELTISPTRLDYGYRRVGQQWRHVVSDSAGLKVVLGADGLHLTAGALVSNPDSSRIGSITADAKLPTFTRWDTPIRAEPFTLEARASLPSLAVLEPWVTAFDTLAGRLDLQVKGEGKVGTPTVTASLTVDSLIGTFPFGSRLQGGLKGDLQATVAPDSSVRGSLTVVPVDLTIAYVDEARSPLIHFDSTALRASAGPDGVNANLALSLTNEARLLATMRGNLALPQYTHIGRPLSPEPIRGSITARADDLGFLSAFTEQVDSSVGHADLDAVLAGTLGDARLSGTFELCDAAARLPILGITLDSVDLRASGDRDGIITVDGRLRSGGGNLTIAGSTSLTPTVAAPGEIRVEGERFEAVHNAQVHALVSPRLRVRLVGDTIGVTGNIALPLAAITLSEIPDIAIAPSDDVVLLDSIAPPPKPRPIDARVRLTLGDSVSFKGFNFNATFGGSITATQPPNGLATATGVLTIIQGHYKAYGQDLTITDGQVRYAGGPVDDPGLSIRASRTAEDSVEAGLQVTGTLKSPVLTLFSSNSMSQSNILSYIVRGRPLGGGSGASENLMNKALTSLGLRGGSLIAGAIGHEIGLDEARFETTGDLRQASFFAGRYLSPRLYVSYGIGLFDPVSTLRLRYILSNRLTLQAETGRETSADVLMKKETGKPRRPPRAARPRP